MRDVIKTFAELGLSPIPVFPADHPDRPKRPVGSWKLYQAHVPTLAEIQQLFPNGNSYSVALVAGKVSGNLEILDFDEPELFAPFMDQLRAARPELATLLLTQQTPSGGYHLLYRCTEPVQGNLKLARSADGKETMIETRGEGGYFLVSPSPGYRMEADISLLQTITAEDRAFLHGLARSFNQHTEQTREPKRETSYHPDGDRPGDVLERVVDWKDLLTAYGWQYIQTVGDRHHYSRPGKTPLGTSATVNEVGLYVFSSSTPIPAEKPIRKLAFMAYSRFNGDFTAAARWVVKTYPKHFPKTTRQSASVADKTQRCGCVADTENCEGPEIKGCGVVADKTTLPGESMLEDAVSTLATLSKLKYDQARKEAAEKLGVRATVLDQVVKEARNSCGIDTDLPFEKVIPWPEQINPAEILSDVAVVVRRFIVCNREVSNAVSLWVAMTWFMDVVQVAPLAVITAPEKRCGKTILLGILGRLTARAITASSISPAALFRAIDAWNPTLLIDEVDATLKDNEELRGIINSGHTRDSAYVIRTVGDTFTPTKFSTWGAKALSGIGHVADTLMDRAIILELRRKLPHEQVDRLRHGEPGLFSTLAAKLARFAEDYSDQVRQARPYLPPSLNDRAQDNWEPLLAIAMVAGPEWLDTATKAALKLSGGDSAAQSIGTELLGDIKEIFELQRVERISTADLIKALVADDEKPWATYNRGLQIKPRQIATRLKGYGIISKSIRVGPISTPKGYEKRQFDEAFARYLYPPEKSATTPQPNKDKHLGVADNIFETQQSATVADNAEVF